MKTRGYSMVELMITLAIATIIFGIAVPNFLTTLASARVRGVAESIYSGLLLARSEAIKRNAPMRFQLVSTMDASCTLSASSRLWLVTQYTDVTSPANLRGVPTGRCNTTPNLPADPSEPCPTGSAASCVTDPFIAYLSATDAVANVDVAATPTTSGSPPGFVVTFGPLGQLLDNLEGAKSASTPVAYSVAVTPSAGSTARRWTVQVNANGGVKLCDPAASDALACS